MNAVLLAGTLLLAGGVAQQPAPEPTPLDQALECRAYVDMARSVHADNPRMRAIDERMLRFWTRRSEELGREAGMDDDALTLRQLLIPLQAERFQEVMLRCFEQTPRSELR